jgi:hypothetical protein
MILAPPVVSVLHPVEGFPQFVDAATSLAAASARSHHARAKTSACADFGWHDSVAAEAVRERLFVISNEAERREKS